jgi:hypothetical protein
VHAFELSAAKNVAAAYHQGDLTTAIGGVLDLAGDLSDFLHADAALACVAEAFARELQDDSLKSRHVAPIANCKFEIANSRFAI